MSEPSYAALLRELLPRATTGIRWGLDRTRRLLAAAGDPQRKYAVVHVGGTNGKGSVATLVEASLRRAGYRTGLYTSPHLCSFRERIRVDGAAVSADDLLAAAEPLREVVDAEGPSFFEAATALAFHAFARQSVEIAVVEVGLGGRLDATNVVDPELILLTDISVEHRDFLGDTVAEVAEEKAGILKSDVPAATSAGGEALRVLEARARQQGAPLSVVRAADIQHVQSSPLGTRFSMESRAFGSLELHIPLSGRHQAVNGALAVRGLELLPDRFRPSAGAIRDGFAEVRLPGRIQRETHGGVDWIYDVAHNPAAMSALVDALDALPLRRPLIALVGILADKEWGSMLPQLARVADRVVLTVPPGAPPARRWNPATAATTVRDAEGASRVSIRPAFDRALANVARRAEAGTALVTGSFYTVGAALAAHDLAPDGVDPPLPPADAPA